MLPFLQLIVVKYQSLILIRHTVVEVATSITLEINAVVADVSITTIIIEDPWLLLLLILISGIIVVLCLL